MTRRFGFQRAPMAILVVCAPTRSNWTVRCCLSAYMCTIAHCRVSSPPAGCLVTPSCPWLVVLRVLLLVCRLRGQGTEYRGERSGDQNDEMCVVVRAPEIKVTQLLPEPKTP